MSFSLPDLPPALDALAPYMSRAALELHHAKHHLTYAAKMLDAAMNKVSHAA
jgi:superoxide dismutase, Fe-Mn family